jgi:hypothetical protein
MAEKEDGKWKETEMERSWNGKESDYKCIVVYYTFFYDLAR